MRGGGIMSDNITKRVGLGTAYGFAKAGGYEGTVEEFTELLGNIAIDLARIENLSVAVTTLPAGSQATASLNGSVLSLGIPKGDKGDKGNTGDTGSPAGFGTVSATVDANIGTPSVEVTASGSDTAKNFAFAFHNLKGQKGDKGDTGEVSEAELAEALEDFAENGTVANAEQLTTKIRANDQTPYLFRTSGGSVDIGDREYINGIVGGTVAWNQLYDLNKSIASSDKGLTLTKDVANGKFTLNGTTTAVGNSFGLGVANVQNHVYFLATNGNQNIPIRISSQSYGQDNYGQGTVIRNTSANTTWYYVLNVQTKVGTAVSNYVIRPMVIDLTAMFGSTIADYIYSLEQANAGAGVAWFKKLFPKPYYAYNAGELMSVKGLVSHDMVGFNAWDEEWINGVVESDGSVGSSQNRVVSKNYIPVIAGQTYCMSWSDVAGLGRGAFYDGDKNLVQYYSDFPSTATLENGRRKGTFTVPSGASYLKFCTNGSYTGAYRNDICINLSWDGSEDGNYEPYQKWSYPLDSDLELRGVPKLDVSNNLYYDGDIYESDGTVTRKYGIVDLGTLTWNKNTTVGTNKVYFGTASEIVDAKKSSGNSYPQPILCSKYITESWSHALDYDGYDKTIALGYKDHSSLVVYDSACANMTAAEFKTAMSGVYLVYELATPTTESADPYTNPQIVDDFGTEEFVISNTVAVPIPVGHNTDYPIDLKAKVEMAPNSPDGDGDYIVRQTNGTNEYVALANNATIQNILSRLEALEG